MLEKIFDRVRRRQEEIARSLIQNPASDMSDYNRRIGQVLGLQEIIDIHAALVREERDADSE